jgi:hypothetical protein
MTNKEECVPFYDAGNAQRHNIAESDLCNDIVQTLTEETNPKDSRERMQAVI